MNNILNQLVNGMNRWNKQDFIELSKLDLEHCEVELFSGKKYTKKEYGNDLFLFIDNKFRLIGASVGAMYQKSFESVSFSSFKLRKDFRKNRSGLEKFAKVIIRVPSDQRIYKPRYNKKYTPVKTNYLYENKLRERLQQYKNNKVRNISKEEVINMVSELTKYTLNSISEPSKLNIFKPFYFWSITAGNILKQIGSLLKEYEFREKCLNDEKKLYNKNDIKWSTKDSYEYKTYLESIADIHDLYKLIK